MEKRGVIKACVAELQFLPIHLSNVNQGALVRLLATIFAEQSIARNGVPPVKLR